MKVNAPKMVKYVISLLLAAALLYFAFRGQDWKEFWEGLRTTRWGFVLLSLVPAIAALVFRAERWRLQLVTLDDSIRRIRIWDGSNIGNFLSLVIPGIGEFYRCAHVSTGKAGYDRTFGTIVMERAWDILAIVLLLLAAVAAESDKLVPFMQDNILGPFAHRFNFSIWWLVGGIVLTLAGIILTIFALRSHSRFCDRCAKMLTGILQGFTTFGRMDRKGLFIAYTAAIWVSYIAMAYFTMLAVPGVDHLVFRDAVFISAVGNIASVIPTPGNLGAYHYIVGLAISTVYLGAGGILAAPLLFATLSHGSHAVLLIILAIISYIAVAVRKDGVSK